MSLSWRSQLRIALSPSRVDLVRLGKLGRGVAAKHSEACSADGWHGAVEALARVLQKHGGSATTIVLSSHFARYVVVPWSEAVSGEEELQALAQHRCSQVYGAMATNWEVRVSQAGFGVPMLACGVEHALLEALRQACAKADVRLHSIQPGLMAAFNCGRGMAKDGWFVLAEPGRLTLALLQRGGWQAVLSRHAEGSLNETLPAMLEQEKMLVGLPDIPQRALLFAPEQPNFVPTAVGNWNLRLLKLPAQNGYSPLIDGAFGLAMCGGA